MNNPKSLQAMQKFAETYAQRTNIFLFRFERYFDSN